MSRTILIVSGIYEGKTFDLKEGMEIRIGRDPFNDMILAYDPCVSGCHALLKFEKGKAYINDLKSSNGSFVGRVRIEPGIYKEIRDFFVVGSTILRLVDNPVRNMAEPLPVTSDLARSWMPQPLFSTALQVAGDDPFIKSVHLFLALLENFKDELSPFWEDIGFELDLDRIADRIESHQVFSGEYQWINNFLVFHAKLVKGRAQQVTPKVRQFMADVQPHRTPDPVRMLKAMLSDDFSLIYPLLDWERTQETWMRGFSVFSQKMSGGHIKRARKKTSLVGFASHLQLPLEFWVTLETACKQHTVVALTGSRGCGKSSVLRFCFGEKSSSPALPEAFKVDDKLLFDPQLFQAMENKETFDSYVERVGGAIRSGGVVGIDHVDALLMQFQESEDRQHELFKALREPEGTLIFALKKENLDMVTSAVDNLKVIEMDRYMEEVLPRIYENLINQFEKRTQKTLSKEARQFIVDRVASESPYDLGRLRSFLVLCQVQIEEQNAFPINTGGESSRLGEAFVREIHESWAGALVASGDTVGVEEEVLRQVENLVHNFAKHILKVHISYGDQTRHFYDSGRMSREEKLGELKFHLVNLLSTYESSFRKWFEQFWARVDPEVLRKELNSTNPKKLWSEFENHARHIDVDYAEDHFHEFFGHRFLETWRSQKVGVQEPT
ncbi:FHA domain-containing protein [Sulfidibacter corallicola]|uniref:FHA domain-containing protein n=1 Tax=Sulfidibacter corallicola TaxID=2818388 RepID=A0A8A4U3M4_SULCO|nr:FHA domain-containing protein [Sulfidibacter corallicola]QTD53345.1 FHA domain-containing protein [Sulfidibacter corallicola]